MNKKKIYDNYLSNIYAGSKRTSSVTREYENLFYWNKKYVLPFFPINKSIKILDVGCGLGQNLYTFKKSGYKNALGIDVSKQCADFCRKKGFKATKTSAENFLKDKVKKFDIITIYHVIEHIEKKKIVSFLKILQKSLKKGGILIINVPNGASIVTASHVRYVDITHEILYTPESLREILILAGFSPDQILVKETLAYSPNDKNILRKIIKKIILPIMTLVTDIIWGFFFASLGSSVKKNRPVLFSISIKK